MIVCGNETFLLYGTTRSSQRLGLLIICYSTVLTVTMSKLKPTVNQQGVFYYTIDSKVRIFFSIPASSKPICFRLKMRTSLCVFAYRPREND